MELRQTRYYRDMSFEDPSHPVPKENRLPLHIQEHKPLAESGESTVSAIQARDAEGKEHSLALKENRKEAFASDEEMHKSKAFYEYLKNFPGFGTFVPDTLYFKARMTDYDTPQSFAIQNLLKGRTLDQITDEELYQDPEVVRELIEFSRAAITILQESRETRSFKPDFGVAGTASEEAQRQGNTFGNSRFTTNVLISDSPDEHGRRVFFVDTGVNANERTNKARQLLERQVMGRIREFHFNRWIKNLENTLSELDTHT